MSNRWLLMGNRDWQAKQVTQGITQPWRLPGQLLIGYSPTVKTKPKKHEKKRQSIPKSVF